MQITSGDSRALLIRGTLLTIFGLAALFWPDATWVTLVRLMGVFALLDAGFALGFSSLVKSSDRLHKPMLISGLETTLTKREPSPKRKHGNIPL